MMRKDRAGHLSGAEVDPLRTLGGAATIKVVLI